jgi:sugar lactone lactonase YvrE
MAKILYAPSVSRLSTGPALRRACAGAFCSAALVACHPSAPQSPASEAAATAGSAAAASAAPSGSVRVLSADAQALQRPTTAAFRGQDLWVAIGQLSVLFGSDGSQPALPFQALSLPLAGGQLGTEKIALPGPDYYPEGTASAEDGTLFIGSIMQGTIVKVPAGSTAASPFVSKPTVQRGVIGLTVDAGRKLLWFCDSNPKLEDAKKAGELVGVQLADAKEVVRHSLPRAEDKAPFCNDVIVSPDGALWVTDSAVGRVFRVPAERALQANSAEVWAAGDEVRPPPTGGSGANGLEWVEGRLVVANVGRGTLVKLDPASADPTRGAQLIALTDAETHAEMPLCSPDGVERVPGSKDKVVVIENGGCPAKQPRIVEVTLRLD